MDIKPVTSGWLMIARSYWMLFGPAFLFILTFQITRGGAGIFSKVDGIYFLGVGTILLARWYEFHHGDPLDSYGEPAQPGDLRRFVLRTVMIASALWVVAKLLGRFWPI